MRRVLLIVAAAVLAVGFLIDAGARRVAEQSVADALQTSLRLKSAPEVTISGWPFLIRVLGGEFPSVTVTGAATNSGGLKLVALRAELHDVKFSLGEQVATVKAGSGRAEITEASLNQELRQRELQARVVLEGNSASVSAPQLGGTVDAEASLKGRRLFVTPLSGPGAINFVLPELTGGVKYSSVRVSNSRLILTLRIENADFEAID